MKTKIFIIISAIAASALILCSCSTNSMRSAGRAVRDTTRRAENYLDNGVNAVENDFENGKNTIIGRGGTYGANSGYNAGIGTGYMGSGSAASRTNRGMINTNKGASDFGTR